jgi:RNA polymerase sigma factor (TIGR02999 family)
MSIDAGSSGITQLLREWRSGDRGALDRLVPLVYADLHRVAAGHLRREGAITLSSTELVHEVCLRLMGPTVAWQDRAHFFAVAARQMRQILVDHARHKQRDKRGGGVVPVTLRADDAEDWVSPPDVIALDMVLGQLGVVDARKRDVLELHYFGGLSYLEMSHVLSVSEATIDRDLRFAKAWLRQALQT